jgi:hypothetical protein
MLAGLLLTGIFLSFTVVRTLPGPLHLRAVVQSADNAAAAGLLADTPDCALLPCRTALPSPAPVSQVLLFHRPLSPARIEAFSFLIRPPPLG